MADRARREVWVGQGGLDAHARGLRTAKRLLCKPNAARIDPDADARVRASFAGLVAGDVEVPEHWRSLVAPTRSSRGTGRRGGAPPG
jgi:hypothetical protein